MNPYITTYLNTVVRIHPSLMDNNIRKHIKALVEKDHVNKCFLDYGYITKIHEIYPDYDAELIAEDPMSCALFKVKFLCTICRPILNSTIIAQLFAATGPTIYLKNGPIDILIDTTKNINSQIFVFNQKLNTWAAIKEIVGDTETELQRKLIVIKKGMYMKIKILNKKIINKSDRILCTGFLEEIATEEEIKQSINIGSVVSHYDSINDYIES
jgi:DNA-directed RNA polymerase subunit E'/Rpb7